MNTPFGLTSKVHTNNCMNTLSYPQLTAFLANDRLEHCRRLSASALFDFTADLPIKMITSSSGPYLERYFLLEENGCFAYLHRFVNEDARDEGVHDHPWNVAYSQVLHGGYKQQVNVGEVIEGQAVELAEAHIQTGDYNLIKGTDFHKITQVENETWTLFAHTEWCRPWGFLHGDPSSGDFRHEIHPSDPNHHWWKGAIYARHSTREPFKNNQKVA